MFYPKSLKHRRRRFYINHRVTMSLHPVPPKVHHKYYTYSLFYSLFMMYVYGFELPKTVLDTNWYNNILRLVTLGTGGSWFVVVVVVYQRKFKCSNIRCCCILWKNKNKNNNNVFVFFIGVPTNRKALYLRCL